MLVIVFAYRSARGKLHESPDAVDAMQLNGMRKSN